MAPELLAPPVAYLLVRRLPGKRDGQSHVRTKIGYGFVTNETLRDVTEQNVYHLAGIVGPFESLGQAESFASAWQCGGRAQAPRGARARMAIGTAMAYLVNRQVFIEISELLAHTLEHYQMELVDEQVLLYPRKSLLAT